MSRPRKPVEVLRFQGTYRKDRHGDRKEYSMDELPPVGDPPEHLSERQRAIWQELRLAAVPGVLRVSDRIFLEITTCLLDGYRHNPDFKLGHLKELTTCLNKLGFGAMDRLRMGIGEAKPPEKDDNPYAHLND